MSRDLNYDFTLMGCLFGGVKLAKNADTDKYVYSVYYIGFDSRSLFSLPNFDWGKNAIIVEVDMSSSAHINNKKKDILILGKGPAQGLDDTTLAAEAQHSVNFSRSNRKLGLSLHYDGRKRFLFVNATKINQFKAKHFKSNNYPLCLGNI